MKLLYLLVPILIMGLVSGYTLPATTFAGNVTMNNHNVVGLAEPSLDTDASTKSYVDNSTGGSYNVSDDRFTFNKPPYAQRFDIASDGTIYAITSDHQLARYNTSSADWDLHAGTCLGVTAINSTAAYVLGTDNIVFKWTTSGWAGAVTAEAIP